MSILLISLVLGGVPALAQAEDPYITVELPPMYEALLRDDFFAPFEATHEVRVQAIYDSGFYDIQSAAADIDAHLSQTGAYVTGADVLYVDWHTPPIAATRAGYWTDIAPLVQADTALAREDFYPAVWESVRWEGGMWALPVGFNVHLLGYDQSAFTSAGMNPPDGSWTLADLITALAAFSTVDAADNVVQPGGLFLPSETGILLLLASAPTLSAAQTPADVLTQPLLADNLKQWAAAATAGYTGYGYSGTSEGVVLTLDTYQNYTASAVLPGGKTAVSISGFAVSPATADALLAYELARYLATSDEFAQSLFVEYPARQSSATLPDEVAAYLAESVPVSHLAFAPYISVALNQMVNDNQTAANALSDVQARAASALADAATATTAETLVLATPELPIPLAAGEVRLRFSLNTPPNTFDMTAWEAARDAFVAQDDTVAQLILTERASAASTDCQYHPTIPSLGQLQFENLDLAPLLATDLTLERTGFIAGTLAAAQDGERLYALPVTLRPQGIFYHVPSWQQAELPLPDADWTIEQFDTAMQTFAGEDIVFSQGGIVDDTYLLQLMAAYGAVPLDYRQEMLAAQWDTAETQAAMQYVLDFAVAGTLSYRQLAPPDYNSIAVDTPPMRAGYYTTNTSLPDYDFVLYPQGSDIAPISYSVGGLTISREAASAEACYRWLTYLMQQPPLFTTMPAYQPQVTHTSLGATHGAVATAIYADVLARLNADERLIIPDSTWRTLREFPYHRVLNQVFDRYVLQAGDWAADIAAAADLADAFAACVAQNDTGSSSAVAECLAEGTLDLDS